VTTRAVLIVRSVSPDVDRERIAALAFQAGFDAIAKPLAACALASFRLVGIQAPATRPATRLGGNPDLPPGTPWPTFRDRGAKIPMTFVAQVDLGTLDANLCPAPRTGLLSFFALQDGGLVVDGAVLHTSATTATELREPPLDSQSSALHPCQSPPTPN
jgi:hypothetical protein